ncbi:MAG: carboxylating nicotinate-nucleotide diphosphorylase [Planctomycetota bacterium]|jgi:nicotinate-nucleotide pyrophosphorylase (carboxylating)
MSATTHRARDLNALELGELYHALDLATHVRALTHMANHEDLDAPPRDITSELLDDPQAPLTAILRTRQDCNIAGLAALPDMLDILAPSASVIPSASDGQTASTGDTIATLRAPSAQLLLAERTILNMLSHLSGIATLTAQFVEQTGGTGTRIFDTRKTLPAYRHLEKYAVRCGGGCSHRLGLHDAILIKDNHISGRTGKDLADWLNETLRGARTRSQPAFIEVEVDTLDQLEAVMSTQPGLIDIILLDNFTPDQLLACVALRKDMDRQIVFEASGGITLDNIAQHARTGIERIAVGAITHSAPAIDIGLDLDS